jgi:hypothetical protein
MIAKGIAGLGFALVIATGAGASTPAFPDAAIGDWSGTVQIKGMPKHLFVHIHKTPTGYAATLDSPERQAGAVQATPIDAPDGVLAFEAGGGQFRGVWNEARGRWEGAWTESGLTALAQLSFNDDNSTRRLRSNGATSPVIELPQNAPRLGFPPDVVQPSGR